MATYTRKQIDFGTIVGAIASFGLVFSAVYLGGNYKTFLNYEAALIVFGGTFGATLINHPLGEVARTLGLIKTAFFPSKGSLQERIVRIVQYARLLRSEALAEMAVQFSEETDPFFRRCLELVSDRVRPSEIQKIMSIELAFIEDRHRRGAQLFQTMGTLAPAMGLVGTLIGLIQMLQNLENPSQIGPAMAVALIATFYGALFANVVFLPIAGKLRSRSDEELLLKELTIEGVKGIASQLNPRAIERRLLGFMPSDKRSSEYE